MVSPQNRRSSSSRRAQYGTFFGYMLGFGGAVVGAGLLAVSLSNPGAFAFLRSGASDAVAPAAHAAAGGRIHSQGLFATITGYFAAASQNAALHREVEATRVRLIEAQALAGENRRLKDLLGLMQADPRPVTAARLIGSTASSTRRFATLDAGAQNGVAVGMPVRSPMGLVGRVLEVGRTTARVMLVTDSESVVPIRRASDGIPAFAQGRSDGTLLIRLISLGINPLKRGDALVTSGAGGLYRPGIAVAIVTTLTRDGAIARVISDPGATDLVVVDPVWADIQPPALTPVAVPSPAPRAKAKKKAVPAP